MYHPTDILVNETSLLLRGHDLTVEDQGIASVSYYIVTQCDQFWAGIAALEIFGIVWFLSSVQLNGTREDLSIYQALPLAFLWCAVGIGLIVFNKLLFLPAGMGFGFPFAVFLMWYHALIGTICTNLLRFLRPSMIPAASERTLSLKTYLANVFPVAALQAVALALGNIAYLYISVAYIQMVKNTTSAFVYVFCVVLALEKGSYSATTAVSMVVAGLIMTSVGEMTFTLTGFLFQMGATLADSLRLSLTKIILSSEHAVRLDPVSALYYAAPTILVFLSGPMLLWDLPKITGAKLWDLKFVLLSNALMAFGLNLTSMFFIKCCGPTTYALTGVVKDIVLIMISCMAFGHKMTHFQFCGFIISLAGFQLYNNLKQDQAYLAKVYSSLRFTTKPSEIAGCEEETAPLIERHAQTRKDSAERLTGP